MSQPKGLLKNIRFFILFLSSAIIAMYTLVGFSGCDFPKKKELPTDSSADTLREISWDTLKVTASAYNSVQDQTGSDNPNITAWGDTIQPGMNVIAVSRDLLKKGLTYNTRVKIEGLEGTFLVKDKMHYRWKNKIDIYMGENVKRARRWGRKKITIYYQCK